MSALFDTLPAVAARNRLRMALQRLISATATPSPPPDEFGILRGWAWEVAALAGETSPPSRAAVKALGFAEMYGASPETIERLAEIVARGES